VLRIHKLASQCSRNAYIKASHYCNKVKYIQSHNELLDLPKVEQDHFNVLIVLLVKLVL